MIVPTFTFDVKANGYISTPFTVSGKATVHIELASSAPVVTLKEDEEGNYANCGQTPRQETGFEITITTLRKETLLLATPVEVTKCYILN